MGRVLINKIVEEFGIDAELASDLALVAGFDAARAKLYFDKCNKNERTIRFAADYIRAQSAGMLVCPHTNKNSCE